MTRTILSCAFRVLVISMLVSTGALAANRPAPAPEDSLKFSRIAPSPQVPEPVGRPFKLKGGGQIDFYAVAVNFAGLATHLGQFTANGPLDPVDGAFQSHGTMTAANGDTLSYVVVVLLDPYTGDALLQITGGTGRFTGATGNANGRVSLDFVDYMFTMDFEGTISY